MKHLILILFILASLFMFGCNKDSEEAILQKDTESIIERTEDQIYNTAGYNPLDPKYKAEQQAKKDKAIAKLKKEDVKVGEGAEVKEGDTITVHYTGKLTNGKIFDSSIPRKAPFDVTIGKHQVIEGWELGLVGMKVGGKRILTIPPELGYGDTEAGPIPANSTLIFEVELLKIK